jgi:hypothetical protein
MCFKAKEIQDTEEVGGTWVGNRILYHIAPMNQDHNRDGYYHVTDEEAIRRCESCGNEESYIKSSKCVWLPRQDQLQEMYGTFQECSVNGGVVTSMEQLWLAFVMKEKHNKVWNGNDWINEK